MNARRLLILVAVLVLSAHTARAEPAVDPIATGRALLASGQGEAARPFLEQALGEDPRSVDALFLLGMLDLAERRYRSAVVRFRQALIHQPQAVRIRLELARAFYVDKDYENAFRQFQFARAGKPPPGVVASIDRYLAAIRLEKSWSYDVGVALAPDTNINNATSAREAVLFGLPFELDENARRKSGVGIAVRGAAEFSPKIGERSRLRLGAGLQRREYDGKRFDDMTLALHAGPRLVLPKWDLSLVGTGFRRWYGGKRFNEAAGVRLEAAHHLDSRTALSIGLSAQDVRYPNSPGQSGPTYALFGGAIRAMTPSSSVTARLGVSRQASHVASFGNWSGVASIGYYRDLAGGFSIYVEPSLSYSRYGAPDPLFGKRRRDFGQEWQIAVLNRRIVLTRFTPRVSYTFARRSSSVNLYEFTQNRVEVGLTSSF